LREEFHLAQKKYQEACDVPDHYQQEAVSMMAVTKKLVTAADKREEEPCEGFKKCISRNGHQQQPHRCSFKQEGSSSSSHTRGEASSFSQESLVGQTTASASAALGRSSLVTHTGKEVHVCTSAEAVMVSTINVPEVPVASRGKTGYHKEVEDLKDWKADDPRRCRKCGQDQKILRFVNQHCVTWKCDRCIAKTAQQWTFGHKLYDGGSIVLHKENCCVAIGGHPYDQIENEDDVARIDTMCTLTMHGDQWSKRYGRQLQEIGLALRYKDHRVLYHFGG
jgi:hypothetical protein